MRIMIDGMNLALEQGTGVATYARNLARCIKLNGHEVSVLYGKTARPYRDPLLREAVFFDQPANRMNRYLAIEAALKSPFTLTANEIKRTGHVVTDHIAARLPAAEALYNIHNLFQVAEYRSKLNDGILTVKTPYPVDIAHWTYPVPVRIEGARNIYTLHDLVPLKLPYATLDSKQRYYRLLKSLAKSADHFVTVSEASRKDIIDLFNVAPGFVTNTYQSVNIPDALLSESVEQRAIDLRALNLKTRLAVEGYYIYVGAIEPKKNVKRLVEAYLSSGVREPLIIVGRRAWEFHEEMHLIDRARRIHYLDYVPFPQLITLIRSARALLFPSIYEGFGLPILEAFLCETPVITADASSTAEIAGDAAHLVNPYATTEIRDAFRALSAPDSADRRAEMARAGKARAARFTEDRIAADLKALYERLMASPPRR